MNPSVSERKPSFVICFLICLDSFLHKIFRNANYNDLLVKPTIVTKQYWSNGSFFTIDNIPLTNLEKKLDYGFYDAFNNCFISETGAKLDHQPQIICSKGISTLSGISYFIERELIIDKTLLDFNNSGE